MKSAWRPVTLFTKAELSLNEEDLFQERALHLCSSKWDWWNENTASKGTVKGIQIHPLVEGILAYWVNIFRCIEKRQMMIQTGLS